MAALTQRSPHPLTRETVRVLAAYPGDGVPVVSLYLDVDGHRYVRAKDYEHQLDLLLKSGRDAGASDEDLAKVERFVKAGIDRSAVRGVAVFSCAARQMWHVVETPVPLRNQIVVNHSPHVRQLESVLDRHQRFGVLLVDRQRCRILTFELGCLVDRTELFDALPRHEDEKGDRDKGDHLRDHEAAAVHHHLRNAAAAAFAAHQEKAFDHVILSSPADMVHDVERELHSYLRDRIAARVTVPVTAPDPTIVQAALAVEQEVERAREAAVVERLRSASATPNGLGVKGLEATLAAVNDKRVEVLLVSEGYEAPGWRCPDCRRVEAKGRPCPVCTTPMVQVDDVVEEAMEEAVVQSCSVVVCDGNADLDVLGRIGAILRF